MKTEEHHAAYSVEACYAAKIDNAAHFADEIEFNLQGTSITDEQDLVSIRIIADDINFKLWPKRRKVNVPQANFNRLYGLKSRHHIRDLHIDSRNT